MWRHVLVIGAAVFGAAPGLAQTGPSTTPPASVIPPREPTPAHKLPPEVAQNVVPGLGAKPSALPTTPGLLPPLVQPPSQPIEPPKPSPPQHQSAPRQFDTGSLRLKREAGQWQLWAGNQLLKDFGPSEADAHEALRVFRELRVNARGSVGGVFEYWLADGQAPYAVTRTRRIVSFDNGSLRVERYHGQWVLRDARIILYNFGPSETEARQALAVCQQYGFNTLGYVGHPTPTLKYLLRDPNPPSPPKAPAGQVVPVSAKLQAAEAPRLPLDLPELGTVGERVPFDSRRLDLRRESGEWVLYAGKVPLGRFGPFERDARSTIQVLQQYRVTELCRVGESGFSFFLANGRAPQGGSVVGLSAKPLRADRLNVKQMGVSWVLCEDARPMMDFGDKAGDARHALAAIRHYGFDHAIPLGGGRLGDMHLFVKAR